MSLGVRASVLPPTDVFVIFVDGVGVSQLVDVNEWTQAVVDVPPGSHVIDFSYQYNMFNVDPLPPSPPNREGKVWIDDIVLADTASMTSKRMQNVDEIGGLLLGGSHAHSGGGSASSSEEQSGWSYLVLGSALLSFVLIGTVFFRTKAQRGGTDFDESSLQESSTDEAYKPSLSPILE